MTPSRAFTPLRDFAPAEPGDADDGAQEANLIDEAEANERLERAVQAAKENAYAQGEAAGKANVEGTMQASLNASVGAIKAQIADLLAKEDDILNKVEVRAVRLMLAIAQKLTTDLSDAEAEKFAAAVARRDTDSRCVAGLCTAQDRRQKAIQSGNAGPSNPGSAQYLGRLRLTVAR